MTASKEWIRFSRPANGKSTVTVTVQDDNHVARWTAPAFRGEVKAGVVEARARAAEVLAEIKEACGE